MGFLLIFVWDDHKMDIVPADEGMNPVFIPPGPQGGD
jgi:hypothetical protein